MSLTAEGLTIQKLSEILVEITESQQELVDPNIDTSDDTLIGQLNSIFAEREAALQELIQVIYDARALNKAEGKALDDLVQILNITRIVASKTAGTERFTGADGTVLVAGFQVRNPLTQDIYELVSGVTLDSQACQEVVISVGTVQDSTNYDITIDGDTYSHPSGVGATTQSIVEGLSTLINAATGVNYTSSEDDVLLTISSVDGGAISVVLGTAFLTIDEVVVDSQIRALETGELVAGPNSVNETVGTLAGLTSVTNPAALITGRDLETDEELRARAKLSGSSSGKATVDAIVAALINDAGITSATVDENTTMVDDNPVGVAAKSFRAVIQGTATNDEIAQIIWDNKPAGISTSGAETGNATDSSGDTQIVNFSRPTQITIDIQVDYEVYSEESLPADHETLMEQAIATEFGNLTVNNDVIPKRFYGPIYEAVSGLSSITVKMAINPASPTDETPIPIASDEIAVKGSAGFTQI